MTRPFRNLSFRHRQLAMLSAVHMSRRQMAGILELTPATVDTYVFNLRKRYGLRNRFALAAAVHRASAEACEERERAA